jgi:dephospho-CoA kinase
VQKAKSGKRKAVSGQRQALLIGIGGQAGSGKTSVARCFARRGAEVIDADRIGWELLRKTAPTCPRLVQAFGPAILDRRGNIVRSRLGAIVFKDARALARLNHIVHPALLAELTRRAHAPTRRGTVRVIDAALLFFWGWHRKVDLAILVTAPREVKLARLTRDGVSRQQAGQRLRRQWPESRMRACADIVIRNDGTPAQLRAACRLAWQTIQARRPATAPRR